MFFPTKQLAIFFYNIARDVECSSRFLNVQIRIFFTWVTLRLRRCLVFLVILCFSGHLWNGSGCVDNKIVHILDQTIWSLKPMNCATNNQHLLINTIADSILYNTKCYYHYYSPVNVDIWFTSIEKHHVVTCLLV